MTNDKRQQFLDEHDRLANLFKDDRFAFERERKRIIKESIDHMYTRDRRRLQQQELDRILSSTGSSDNRFAMIQALFWHNLFQKWQPALHNNSTTLEKLVRSPKEVPLLAILE